MERRLGTESLSWLIFQFGLRLSEAEAINSIRNGVVKVNGEVIVDPKAQFCLANIRELKCLNHVKIISTIG